MSRVFFDRELDTVATYWRIYRKDGVALGFTTHDRDLVFAGMLHRAAPGMLPSAIRKSIELADDGAEVEGALGHDTIRSDDLAAGRFDEARIETGVVDWESMDYATLYSGSIGSVRQDAAGFAAELRSAKADLDIDPVPRASPSCRARFCGPDCALSPVAYTHRAAVSAVDLDTNTIAVDVPDLDLFVGGDLRFLDGPRAGLVYRIIARRASGIELEDLLDPTTSVGQGAILREGCDKTIASCASRFGNAVNFRGEPHLPGNDLLAQYPQPR